MNKLTDEFIASYTGRQAPWGFGGLGEVVYLRTYSRKTETSQESWVETLRRVIDGAVDIGADLTEKEMETLFDHMFNLRCTVSGRALWQLGTPLVKKFNAWWRCWFLRRASEDSRITKGESRCINHPRAL